MRKIKARDTVIVTTGKSKGQTGEVLSVNGDSSIVVKGVNLVKKCIRRNPQTGEQGGIKEIESPLHISNVSIFNPKTSKADKVMIKTAEDGKQFRAFKSNGEAVDV